MKKDKLILLLIILTLGALGLFLFWISKETVSPDFEQKEVVADSLDTDRQLIDIKVDSLLSTIEKLHRMNSEVFSYEDKESGLLLSCQVNQREAFNRLFLNDTSLETFATVKNTSLEIDTDSYNFVLPIRK
ncbi:MAG: hypothetical protein KKG00_08745, partial [Bacteroidetes bacterium]|nr:hypothetical protein [Bacteroidota bacterium]